MNALETLGARAKQASRTLMTASTETKNRALAAAAQALLEAQDAILAENAKDLAKAREVGMASSMLDRLALDPGRLAGMAKGLLEVAELPDPVGVTLSEVVRPNGLRVRKVSVPMGVIAVIFEARPNVSADAAALCLKSGNAVILRGGKEAVRSNAAIVNAMRGAVERAGLPADCICLFRIRIKHVNVDNHHIRNLGQFLFLQFYHFLFFA